MFIIAIRGKEWTGAYKTDFADLLETLPENDVLISFPLHFRAFLYTTHVILGHVTGRKRDAVFTKFTKANEKSKTHKYEQYFFLSTSFSDCPQIDIELEEDSETAVATRNNNTDVIANSFATSFLASRSWKGLEQRIFTDNASNKLLNQVDIGETSVTTAVQGRSGIARGYEGEK